MNELKVPKAWLQGLQKQATKLEEALARASLKPDPYVQSGIMSLLGYLDSIEFLLKEK